MGGYRRPFMKIAELEPAQLENTRRVIAELFPWEDEHQTALAATLDPDAYSVFLIDRRLERTRFWTAEFDGRVVGVAGLYYYRNMATEAWLSWFGLLPEMRGHGNGSRFLDWVIKAVRDEGRAVLRLWTTDEEEYAAAMRLYERRGFATERCPMLAGEEWQTLVMSLGLNGTTPIPWLSIADRPELGGRVITLASAKVA